MANDIDKTSPHYKGDFGSIYEVNKKFPTGGVAGDFVVIEGWAHYWNADRATWCVNAERDSYWDELITNIIEKFKLVRGATYMGVASINTVPVKVIGAKMYYFATVAGTYKNFGDLAVPQGINVLYSENGSSWVNTTLLEVAQELGVSTQKVVSQKVLNDALNLKADQSSVNEALAKKADRETVNAALGKKADKADMDVELGKKADKADMDVELGKKFNKENIAQEFGDSEDKVVSQYALPFREIESKEFIKLIVDANNKILFSINLKGEVDWGKGIPTPIRVELQKYTNLLDANNNKILEINASLGIYLNGKSVAFLGDSLSTFQGYIPKGYPSYYPKDYMDVVSVEQTWWMKLIKESNAKLEINNSYSGSRVSGTLSSSFTKRVENLGNPQYIIINGGTGDAFNNSVPAGVLHFDADDSELNLDEFADSYDLLIRKAISLYPKAFIIVVIPNAVPGDYTSAIIEIAKHYNLFCYVDLHSYRIEMNSGHYQARGMETVKNVIAKTILANIIVYKEYGKSLIDSDVADSHSVIDNPEYLAVETDSDGKVLAGTYVDGSHYAHNMKSETIDGLRETKVDKEEGKSLIDSDVADSHSVIDNPEYLAVETDSDGKVLAGTYVDGSHYAHNMKSETIDGLRETKVDKEEGKSLIDSDVADSHSVIEDPEGRMNVELDADNKVLSYRDSSGVKHETKMEVNKLNVSNINLQGSSVQNIEDALKANGFSFQEKIDLSKEAYIQVPIPRTLARINIIAKKLPSNASDLFTGSIEYYDFDGNYFKLPIKNFKTQGNSSKGYAIKNFAFDLDSTIGDNGNELTHEIKFGHWIAQDSFHLKAFYIDVFVGIGNIGYNYIESLYRHTGFRPSRNAINENSINEVEGIGDTKQDFDTGALCHPEGFPVELYFNGEYYALYALNLKKHRANYLMDKKDYSSVHIDGSHGLDYTTSGSRLWYGSENLNWSFLEIKNPKKLICMDGSEYNDDAPKELIDETSELWDSSNKDMKNTLRTKQVIKDFSDKWKTLSTLLNEAASLTDKEAKAAKEQEAKEFMATFYDINAAILHYVIGQVIFNFDGMLSGNTQWEIYKAKIMAPTFYDLDSIFGRCGWGMRAWLGDNTLGGGARPYWMLFRLYNTEIKEFYAKLRNEGYISTSYIMSFVNQYLQVIGYDALKRNIDMRKKKGLEIPSFRDSLENKDYWEYISDSYSVQGATIFDSAKEYNVGDIVSYGKIHSFHYKCVKSCTGIPPTTGFYSSVPYDTGMYDSPKRIEKWLNHHIQYLDTYFNYKKNV